MSGERFQLNEQILSFAAEIGQHMPGGFFIYQAEHPGKLLYANQTVFDIFGCADLEEFTELTGFTFEGMLHPDDYRAISESIDKQIDANDDDMDHVEYRIIRKDGAVRWVDDFGHYSETDTYGGVYYVFISDITEKHEERNRAEETRNAVISALTNIYNTVWFIDDVETEHSSLYHTDMDAIHEKAIRNALNHALYTDTKTEYVETMVAEQDRERMQKEISLPYILEQFETRERFSVNFIRELESGPRHYRIDFGKVHMPGNKIGVVLGFKDVDEEVRREEENQATLLAHEQRRLDQDRMITALASDYRSVYQADLDLDDAVCFRGDPDDTDQPPEGVHFPFLKWFSDYAQLRVSEEYRQGFLDFIDPDNIRKALASDPIIAYRYLARNGDKEYYEMLRMAGVRRAKDRDDGIVHAVGVGFTVIDAEMRETLAKNRALSEALSAAEDANRAKTAFLSNMSHEIRTPMNAIIGLDSIALADEQLPERIREHLEKIGGSAQHLLDIINDILDVSRIESGRMTLKSETFSFAKMLEQVNTIIGGQCDDKGLTYNCRIDRQVADSYIGDGTKVRQVLINILGNAVKFTPTGGTVDFLIERVAHYEDHTTLRFTIADSGIGMDEDFIPRVFDAFAQEDSTTTSKYGSTGLGLAITKSIVEMMNGTVEVESTKGEGSTFIVTITLGDAEDAAMDYSDMSITPHELSVLVIDDDPVACEHAKLVLEEVGISAQIAQSGAEAVELARLRQARRDPFDLILVDWKMPEMDGIETTRQLRSITGDESAIIILTAYNWDDVVGEATGAGVDSFIAKPLFATNVLDEFKQALEKKNLAALEHHKANLTGRKVLLAEDVEINAEIMMGLLGMRGIDADHAINGKVAVDMFAASEPGHYDAILMDMRMPEMDGLTATEMIRAMDRDDAKTVPIIALTANAFDEDVQKSLQAGLNAHLSKPIEPDAVFETLESLIAD